MSQTLLASEQDSATDAFFCGTNIGEPENLMQTPEPSIQTHRAEQSPTFEQHPAFLPA